MPWLEVQHHAMVAGAAPATEWREVQHLEAENGLDKAELAMLSSERCCQASDAVKLALFCSARHLQAEDGLDVLGRVGVVQEGRGEAVVREEGPVAQQRRQPRRAVLAVRVPLDQVLRAARAARDARAARVLAWRKR